MGVLIDKTFEWNNTILFKSNLGAEYIVNLLQTSPNSNIWTLNFALINGHPANNEVFKIMSTLQQILISPGGLIEKNNVKKIAVTISGKNNKEIDMKTKIFTRWIKKPWIFEIHYNPEVEIIGKREKIYPRTNIIFITKTEEIIANESTNNKYCFYCGSINKGYKFCPSCGTNLQP